MTLSHHTDKVQAIVWNPAEASCLLTGSFDGSACVCDARAGVDAVARWQIGSDAEALTWNPHVPTMFAVSAEDGHVHCFDTRGGEGSKALFTLAAHSEATTNVMFNPSIPDLLVTASTDKTVRHECLYERHSFVQMKNCAVVCMLNILCMRES
jgi:periodic tryptophan protein 1